jgi:hypothetical protein
MTLDGVAFDIGLASQAGYRSPFAFIDPVSFQISKRHTRFFALIKGAGEGFPFTFYLMRLQV